MRSRNNSNKDTSKDRKEISLNKHPLNKSIHNNQPICFPLKKSKTNIQNAKNSVDQRLMNFEEENNEKNNNKNSFVNFKQRNNRKFSEKIKLDGVYLIRNFVSNYALDPSNKNPFFRNKDLFENDSINFNNNDITFNVNDFKTKAKEDNIYENTNSLLNKVTMSNEIISENFNISMEIDDRLIPEFSTCSNKFNIIINNNINNELFINKVEFCDNTFIYLNNHNNNIENFDINNDKDPIKLKQKFLPDVADNSHPERVKDYIDDIFNHLKNIQFLNNPSCTYMRFQPDINEKMRGILIDWLVEVHLKFKLLPETLFLTVNLIDRFLSERNILRTKLQLVGVSCLFIACKYEEIYPPELKDFVFITDNAYNKQEIIEMENEILSVLKFEVTTPSALGFLEIYKYYLRLDEISFMFCRYLLELFLLEYSMNKYNAYLLACASLYITFKITKKYDTEKLIELSDLKEEKLRECSKDICCILDNIEKLPLLAIRKKFSHSKFYEVAKIKLF